MSMLAVRERIAETLRAGIPGMHASAYVVDQVHPPHAMVSLSEIAYRMVEGSSKCQRNLVVSVYVPRDLGEKSQAYLDEVMELDGARSLFAVIEADDLLQGRDADAVCNYAEVVRARGPEEAAVGTVPYLVVDFEIEVVL